MSPAPALRPPSGGPRPGWPWQRVAGTQALRVTALFLVPLLLTVAAGCSREPEPEPSLPAPVARWLAAAYHEAGGAPRQRLQRWSGDLALSAAGEAGPDDLALLRRTAQRLAVAAPRRQPRLEYQPTAFVVRYLPPVAATGPERGPDPRVEVDCPADAAGRIHRAEVRVPTGDWIPQALRDDLALEGLVTCLGLPGRLASSAAGGEDAEGTAAGGATGEDAAEEGAAAGGKAGEGAATEYESVLAAEPNWGDVHLTDADLLTLSVHFDSALSPGLTAPQALTALGLDPTLAAGR